MTVTQQQLVLAINVPQEQVESIVSLYPEGTAKPTFHLLSTTHYLSNREHPEPSLILLKLDSAGQETSGIAEAISESPHPLILIHSGGHYCSSWWRPAYPQLRDCLPDRDNERISTAILRELETLELRNKLKKKQFRLNNISQGLNSIVSNGHEAAALIHNGQYLKANKAYRKLFAFNPEQSIHEIIVPKVFSKLEGPHHSLGPPCNKKLKSCSLTRQTGEQFQAEILSFPLLIKDKQSLQVIVRNPSLKENSSEAAQQLLHKDELTGLINRQYFLKQLKEKTEHTSHKEEGGLALILVDRFKRIREERGILFSDQLLTKVSHLIEGFCHPDELVARFNDAVFAIYTTRLTPKQFSNLIEQIQKVLSETLFESGEDYLQITCSIGASLWNQQLSDMQELITRADQACAKAAQNGGNQVQLYSGLTTPLSSALQEQKQNAEISAALTENRFRLIYQPIVHLNGSDNPESYAVLIRMISREGQHILPDQFIHLAEKTGTIYNIDKWVIHQTCLLIKRAQIHNSRRLFFVKLSGESLNNKNFLPYLYNCLNETGINGKSLVFQIDYSEYRAHPAIVKNFILGIKKAQCLFAFDHFGFGQFRSLDLQELPIDYLKIDGAFIRDLLDNPEHRSTIKRVISASRPLNIKTIAKSVESANTLAALWNLGVDAVQGYFLQEPSEVMKYDFSYQDEDE